MFETVDIVSEDMDRRPSIEEQIADINNTNPYKEEYKVVEVIDGSTSGGSAAAPEPPLEAMQRASHDATAIAEEGQNFISSNGCTDPHGQSANFISSNGCTPPHGHSADFYSSNGNSGRAVTSRDFERLDVIDEKIGINERPEPNHNHNPKVQLTGSNIRLTLKYYEDIGTLKEMLMLSGVSKFSIRRHGDSIEVRGDGLEKTKDWFQTKNFHCTTRFMRCLCRVSTKIQLQKRLPRGVLSMKRWNEKSPMVEVIFFNGYFVADAIRNGLLINGMYRDINPKVKRKKTDSLQAIKDKAEKIKEEIMERFGDFESFIGLPWSLEEYEKLIQNRGRKNNSKKKKGHSKRSAKKYSDVVRHSNNIIPERSSETVKAVKMEVDKAKSLVKSHRKEVNGVKDNVRGLSLDVQNIGLRLDTLESENQSLRSRVKNLENRCNNMQDTIDRQCKQIIGLQEQLKNDLGRATSKIMNSIQGLSQELSKKIECQNELIESYEENQKGLLQDVFILGDYVDAKVDDSEDRTKSDIAHGMNGVINKFHDRITYERNQSLDCHKQVMQDQLQSELNRGAAQLSDLIANKEQAFLSMFFTRNDVIQRIQSIAFPQRQRIEYCPQLIPCQGCNDEFSFEALCEHIDRDHHRWTECTLCNSIPEVSMGQHILLHCPAYRKYRRNVSTHASVYDESTRSQNSHRCP